MKKIKHVFPSRNYITVDSFGDVEVIFNPVGDGFEGDDKLMFRKGRWAFRVNDFLAGKTMPDGSKEGMGRKVYSLNLVYNEEDGEPIVNTTYVDPTSVIPLDGSLVEVSGSEKLAQESTVQTLAKEETVQTLCKEKTLKSIDSNVGRILNSLGMKTAGTINNNIPDNTRFNAGTVIKFSGGGEISLRSPCISHTVVGGILLMGDISFYTGGEIKRLNGIKFSRSDVTQILV